MAIHYAIHPQDPQQYEIEKIKTALQKGAVMLYPTDTVYAIGCDLNHQNAVKRVRQIKRMSNDKPLTFLCSSLSNISEYAVVSDPAYRLMKHLIPGTYTFILPSTKLVPKMVMSPKRKTTGIRVPDNPFCQAILQNLGNPIISTSAHFPDEDGEFPTMELERARLFDQMDKLVDIVIETGEDPGFQVSTIIDLSNYEPTIVRKGMGWQEAQNWLPI
jgi:tRNA threonylcarbamoyl adenosine modification protein (Sua5/YciO/YrdC/YwlC family)